MEPTILPIGVRGLVYSYLTLTEMIEMIAVLSKREREFLTKTQLTSWHRDQKGIHDKYSNKRKIILYFNSRLQNNPDAE